MAVLSFLAWILWRLWQPLYTRPPTSHGTQPEGTKTVALTIMFSLVLENDNFILLSRYVSTAFIAQEMEEEPEEEHEKGFKMWNFKGDFLYWSRRDRFLLQVYMYNTYYT